MNGQLSGDGNASVHDGHGCTGLTGQQVGLLTGPLLTAVKALATVKVAEALTGLAELAAAQGRRGEARALAERALAIHAAAQTGEISQALNSGKHTTTTTTWYWLDGARTSALIDSPGFQEFGLRHIDPMQLAAYMPDIKPHVTACRFYNCTHLHEPGCGVRAAVDLDAQSAASAQQISANRYKIYSDLFGELRGA